MTAGQLEYHVGRLDAAAIETEKIASGIQYRVPVPGLPGGKHAFHQVIIRHGPSACLNALPEITAGYEGINEAPAKDRTRTKLYPGGFYPPRKGSDKGVVHVTHASLTGALAETPFKDEAATPLVVESGLTSVEVRSEVRSNPRPEESQLASVEVLTRTLLAETRAQNYSEARDAAERLEEIVAPSELVIPKSAWQAANSALWEFEIYRRGRDGPSSNPNHLARLRTLIERMERG